MYRLENKVAVITGAGSGVGRACMEAFAREGAQVVGAGRRIETLEETLEIIASQGFAGIVRRCDVSVEADCKKIIESTIEAFGKIDILVNNAGVGYEYADDDRPDAMNSLAETPTDDWQAVININLNSVYYMCKHAIPSFRETGGGSIVNVSSVGGFKGMTTAHAYSAAKAGMTNLTRSMALRYGPENIRTNTVSPGGIATKMIRGHLAKLGNPHLDDRTRYQMSPLGRLAEPEEIANAILFFASDESSYCNGANLLVDGGSSA